MAIHIGCGSWADPDYAGLLYPKGTASGERLRAYARWFDRVELNYSYHTTPTPKQMSDWAAQTPRGFLFDFKLHKSFSQNPAPATASATFERMIEAIQPLLHGKKLGAFLLTLPPSFGPGQHRLEELDALVGKKLPRPLAVELRHRDWVAGDVLDSTLDYFRRNQLVWVALDLPKIDHPALRPPIDEVTNPKLAYLRLHGRNPNYVQARNPKEKHLHDYTGLELQEIAARIRALATRAKDVHVSVNNHAKTFAPKAALALRRLLGQSVKGLALEKQDSPFGGE